MIRLYLEAGDGCWTRLPDLVGDYAGIPEGTDRRGPVLAADRGRSTDAHSPCVA